MNIFSLINKKKRSYLYFKLFAVDTKMYYFKLFVVDTKFAARLSLLQILIFV